MQSMNALLVCPALLPKEEQEAIESKEETNGQKPAYAELASAATMTKSQLFGLDW